MKKLYYVACAAAAALCLCATSCSKDEEPTTNQPGQTTDPNKTVPDPEGTVTMNMLKGDYNSATHLSDIYINEALNFSYYGGGFFIDLGEMKGVGNIDITRFAINNAGGSCAVLERHGYIASSTSKQFPSGAKACWAPCTYGIYVVQYLTSGESLAGAIIKYIQPTSIMNKLIAECKAEGVALFYEKYRKEFENGEMEIKEEGSWVYLRYRQIYEEYYKEQ